MARPEPVQSPLLQTKYQYLAWGWKGGERETVKNVRKETADGALIGTRRANVAVIGGGKTMAFAVDAEA